MAPLPPAANVVKVRANWKIKGDTTGQTVHYFRWSGAASSADLSTFASAVVSQGSTEFQALADDDTGMESATVVDLSSSMGNEATAGTPWVGTRGTALTSPGTAILVNHSIARHYRGGHPRTYLPLGVAGDITTSGLWSTGFQSSVDSAWGAWVAALTATYGSLTITQLVNVSYYSGFIPFKEPSGRYRNIPTLRSTPQIDTITGHVTNAKIASQRRRNKRA